MLNFDTNLLDVWTQAMDPMRAEVRLRLRTDEPLAELRGRLMGPRCRFTTTIEIAYPLRPTASATEYSAAIPEPSLWSPAKPFLYEGPVECWQEGELRGKVWIRRCFRSLKLGPKGLILNGKDLVLKGIDLQARPESANETGLLDLRDLGCNAILVQTVAADLQEWADRLGFFIVVAEPGRHVVQAEAIRLELPQFTCKADGSFDYPSLDS